MLALTSGGTVTHWAAIAGKILLLVAGLAALLDLIGPRRLSTWARRAEERRIEILERRRRLRTARHLRALVTKMAAHAAVKEKLATDYFSTGEFVRFTQDGHTALKEKAIGPLRIALFFTPRAYPFLLARLPAAEKAAFEQAHREADVRTLRYWQIGSVILILLSVPVAMLFLQVFPSIRLSLSIERNFLLLLGIFVVAAGIVNALWVGVQSPVVVLAIMRAGAGMQIRLAQAVLTLIGRDGRGHPMRWTALVVFLVGSLVDLMTSW